MEELQLSKEDEKTTKKKAKKDEKKRMQELQLSKEDEKTTKKKAKKDEKKRMEELQPSKEDEKTTKKKAKKDEKKRMEELQLSKEDEKTTTKKAKKAKKAEKKRKLAEIEAGADIPLSISEGNIVPHIESKADEAARNGDGKAEQPIEENGGTGDSALKSMSVREKKGKKKVSKDRWGVKIANEDKGEEIPIQTEPVKEVPSTITSASELVDPKKVVVGGMPYYLTEDEIYEYFVECGEISELDCMTFPDTGKFRGIAFVSYKTEEGAAKALEYDGSDMGGRFLKIEMCKVKPRASAKDPERGEVQKTPGSLSSYIGNLSWDVTEDVIKNFFKKAYSDSKIDSIRLAFDKETGDFKGFGHVDFSNDESLEAAIKLNQTPLLGRPTKIAYSVPPKRTYEGNRDGNASRPSGTCYTCGEEGHKAFLCPEKVNATEKKKVGACYSCGEEGHKSNACPQKNLT